MAAALADLLSDLRSVFQRTGSRWYVFGAQAAIIHGASRLTADVDVTVIYGDRPVEDLIQLLEAKGFTIRVADAAAFVTRSRVLPVLHVRSGLLADIVFGAPGLEESFARRALQHEMAGIKVPVASAEDVVSMKILAGRDKDVEDALSIISAQIETLDLPHIQATLRTLEGALDRSDLLPILNDLVRRAR